MSSTYQHKKLQVCSGCHVLTYACSPNTVVCDFPLLMDLRRPSSHLEAHSTTLPQGARIHINDGPIIRFAIPPGIVVGMYFIPYRVAYRRFSLIHLRLLGSKHLGFKLRRLARLSTDHQSRQPSYLSQRHAGQVAINPLWDHHRQYMA